MPPVKFFLCLLGLVLSAPLAWTQFVEIELDPLAHIDLTASAIDGAEFEDLPLGAHDPRDEFVLQGIESRLMLKSSLVDGTLIWNFFHDGDDWGEENEEAYLTLPTSSSLSLPADAILRGGRMLNRFGVLNNSHLHEREWRDMPLVHLAFLGEEGLTTDGADLTLPVPATWYQSVPGIGDASIGFTLGFGKAREHDEHGHNDRHDEEEDDHEEEDGDEHGHEEIEAPLFAENLLTARFAGALEPSDHHRFLAGISFAHGEDEDGGDLSVAGIDLTTHWRENGYQDGRSLHWSNELLLRDTEQGGSELGGYSQALLRFPQPFGVGLRVGALEGNDALDTESSWRISPMLAWYPRPGITVRLQGNHLELPKGGDAQSVNLGLSLSNLGGFGSGEGHEGHSH